LRCERLILLCLLLLLPHCARQTQGEAPVRVLTYCNSREVAGKVHDSLRQRANGAAVEGAVVAPDGADAVLARGDETILLVEDEAAILTMGTKMLESLGYRVIAASSPVEALGLAGEHGAALDLVVTDVVMPQMNGSELVERLRTTQPNVPVLYMSGYTDDVVLRQGVLTTGVPYLQKPFSVARLAAAVRKTIDEGNNPTGSTV